MSFSLAERLRMLARHLEAFEQPDFSFGDWEPSTTAADGSLHLGWYRFSAEAEAFLADARAGGWLTPFDWPAWLESPEGAALAEDPAAVAGASVEDLQRLLTAIVRSERFGEGSIAGAYESGLLTAIVRRAGELADAG
jgi:hypothetical protein